MRWRLTRAEAAAVPPWFTSYASAVSNLCLCRTRASAVSQQVQSASVSVNSDQVAEQSTRCKTASCQLKQKSEQPYVHILNRRKNPALRHNRNFHIATAQRQHEAIPVFIDLQP